MTVAIVAITKVYLHSGNDSLGPWLNMDAALMTMLRLILGIHLVKSKIHAVGGTVFLGRLEYMGALENTSLPAMPPWTFRERHQTPPRAQTVTEKGQRSRQKHFLINHLIIMFIGAAKGLYTNR
jgi:hypothetical protein